MMKLFPDTDIQASNLSLYALWDIGQQVAKPPIEISNDIGAFMRTIGSLTIVHLIWLPGKPVKVRASEIENVLYALQKRLDDLHHSTPPSYLIFHIDKLTVLNKGFSLSFTKKVKARINSYTTTAKEAVVDDIQLLCGLGQKDIINGWAPNFFLPDPTRSQPGCLVISPTRALLIDVSREQVDTFINLFQLYATLDNTGPGLRSDDYKEFRKLVLQWVSNLFMQFQTLRQFENLIKSGTQAIDGQVWLNFAVAAIGIVIAILLIPGQMYQIQLEWTFVCLGIASLMFWAYARSGRRIFLIAGWIACATIAIIFLPLWLTVVNQLLQHL